MPTKYDNPLIPLFLASDHRFSNIDIRNDQVWELGMCTCEPSALSLTTTFGLRAKRMHLFPAFSTDNYTVTQPQEYHSFPRLEFSSGNFALLAFSPFKYIDAQLRIWVPDSHSLLGQITISNTGDKTRIIGFDCHCQLNPFPGGKPMAPMQMGINKILQGESAGIYPVFFITGGPEESLANYPGLGMKMVLMPGSSRQVTWVLASLDSVESSFLLARHFSSKRLDEEQIKIEMADKKEKVFIHSEGNPLGNLVDQSQNQAFQLIMPVVNQFKNPTFLVERNPDTGFNLRNDLLLVKPEWSGQTLTDTWMIMQNLLPGRPETLRGILQNFLDSQDDTGRIDFRTNSNKKPSGILAPPILSSIVNELHPYLDDSNWLKKIYPALRNFLQTWIKTTNKGEILQITEWSHPSQTGISRSSNLSDEQMIDFWVRNISSEKVYLLSLLYRETRSLSQIARWIDCTEDINNFELLADQLKHRVNILLGYKGKNFQKFEKKSPRHSTGKILFTFKKDGEHSPVRKITTPGKLYVRIISNGRLSPGFRCILTGTGEKGNLQIVLTSQSFLWIGPLGVYVTEQCFTSANAINIKDWHKGDKGWIGQADFTKPDITDFLPLWAETLTREQADQLLEHFGKFLTPDGLSLVSDSSPDSPQKIPGFLAALLMEGLILYDKSELAEKVFQNHFIRKDPSDIVLPGSSYQTKLGSIENLIPVKLYLMGLGLKKVTSKEVILTHFNYKPDSVTVQYDKVTYVLEHEHVSITTGFAGQILIDKPGPHKILFD